jgi:DNA mismatch repair protein MutS2
MATITSLRNSFSPIDPCASAGQRFLMLEKFSIPNPATLNYCANLILTFSNASTSIPSHTLFKDKSLKTTILLKIVQEIRFFIDSNGNINYEKHPALRAQNDKINNLSRQIRDRIQSLIRDELYQNSLAYDQYDIFDDRYVLPIKADHYRYEHGMIVSRSQSGQTLLVEPLELRELANKRLRELSFLDEIINKLCIDIGKAISSNFEDCRLVFQTLHELDLIICKTIFSIEKNLTMPDINTSNEFILEEFFHPLIDKPVVNSIQLTDDKNGLLLSGPNTGGKTVTLKSLCLCFMFFRLGLFSPAKRVSLPQFNNVYFFSHDQQSLEKGLSSFSSESERYLSIIDNLQDRSFVFIDEIFNSTSSEEASALALGFIDFITSRTNAKLFISSHHHRLKAIIHQRDDFLSAHVGFDVDNESPTYKLHIGSPGPSMAITIFKNFSKRFFHSTQIAQLAEAYLESGYINYEQLLESLNTQKENLESKNSQLQMLVRDSIQQKSAAEGVLHLEKQRMLSDFEIELSKKISVANELISRLRNKPEGSQKSYFNELSQIKSYLPKAQKQENLQVDLSPIDPLSIMIGKSYFHSGLAQDVQVLEINPRKSKFLVLAGNLKIWTEADKLFKSKSSKTLKQATSSIEIIRHSTSSISIDARGLRLDQFKATTEQAISNLFCDDLPYVEIIHGHGDGILKKWLRDYLKSQNDIEWTTPEGNDGSTIIKAR